MKNNLKKQALRAFFPLLFVSYWAAITLFVHPHVVNGVTIVHSHPFAKDKHTHSEAQFQLIDLLNSFSTTECDLTPWIFVAMPILPVVYRLPGSCPIHSVRAIRLFSLRAPPASFLA